MLSILVPVFALIATGLLLRRLNVITEAGIEALGKLLYWFALPAQLLVLGARTDLSQNFDPRALAAVAVAFVLALIVGWFATARLDPGRRGSALNGFARANGAFIALPIVELTARTLPPAEAHALLGAFALLLGPTVILFNIGAVLAFRMPHHGVTTAGLLHAVAELPRNPLIIGCALGALFGFVAPGALATDPFGQAFVLGAGAAVPLALLVSGASLSWTAVRGQTAPLALVCLAKLVLVPAATGAIAWALGCSHAGIVAAVLLMAAPAAMAAVPMARLLGGDVPFMAAVVTATTVLAAPALAGWLLALRALQLLPG